MLAPHATRTSPRIGQLKNCKPGKACHRGASRNEVFYRPQHDNLPRPTGEARKRRDDFVYHAHRDSVTEVIRRVVPGIGPATFGVFEPPETALVCSYPPLNMLSI